MTPKEKKKIPKISKPSSIKIYKKDVMDICSRCGKEFCNIVGAITCYECSNQTKK